MPDTIPAAILALDDRRTTALVARDLNAFAALLADDVLYVHPSGRIDESKAAHLAGRQKGANTYLKFEKSEQSVRVLHDTTAILTGRIKSFQEVKGAPKMTDTRYTIVWSRPSTSSNDWRMVNYQVSPILPK